MCCSLLPAGLAAVTFLAATGAVQTVPGSLLVGTVGKGLVVAVTAPAAQALERGLGGLPVAAMAGRLPAGLGAQQPLRVGLVLPVGQPYRRPSTAASAMGVFREAAALPQLGGPIGRLGEPGGRRSGPPVVRRPTPTMLRRPGVVEAVGAPVAVQFGGGHAPRRPLLGVGGDGAEFGHQPAR